MPVSAASAEGREIRQGDILSLLAGARGQVVPDPPNGPTHLLNFQPTGRQRMADVCDVERLLPNLGNHPGARRLHRQALPGHRRRRVQDQTEVMAFQEVRRRRGARTRVHRSPAEGSAGHRGMEDDPPGPADRGLRLYATVTHGLSAGASAAPPRRHRRARKPSAVAPPQLRHRVPTGQPEEPDDLPGDDEGEPRKVSAGWCFCSLNPYGFS